MKINWSFIVGILMKLGNVLFIQGQLFNFISYLAKSANVVYKDEANKNFNPYVDKGIEYIQNNYQNIVTVNEIAEYLSLNKSYLTLLFKRYLNISPQEFLLKYRITRAEELLINTSLTMS